MPGPHPKIVRLHRGPVASSVHRKQPRKRYITRQAAAADDEYVTVNGRLLVKRGVKSSYGHEAAALLIFTVFAIGALWLAWQSFS